MADSASVSAIARHQDAYDAGCLLPGGSALARAYDFTSTV